MINQGMLKHTYGYKIVSSIYMCNQLQIWFPIKRWWHLGWFHRWRERRYFKDKENWIEFPMKEVVIDKKNRIMYMHPQVERELKLNELLRRNNMSKQHPYGVIDLNRQFLWDETGEIGTISEWSSIKRWWYPKWLHRKTVYRVTFRGMDSGILLRGKIAYIHEKFTYWQDGLWIFVDIFRRSFKIKKISERKFKKLAKRSLLPFG